MRGTVAKRLRRQVIEAMPGQGSELKAVVVTRGPNTMRKLRLRAQAARGALMLEGRTLAEATILAPDPRPQTLMAVSVGPRAVYQRVNRAYMRGEVLG